MGLSAETYKNYLMLKVEDFNLNLELSLVYLNDTQNYYEAAIYLNKCIQFYPDRIDLYEKIFAAHEKSNDHLNAFNACMKNWDIRIWLSKSNN